MQSNEYKVLLPKRIWEQATNKEEAKRMILDYMQRYPNYRLLKVKNKMAICERIESEQR